MPLPYLSYDEPLFRPPAEAFSAIVQATIGCSWNRCAFCEMYTTKKFRVRDINDIQADIKVLSGLHKGVKKVFIADGNAFVLSANRLTPILEATNKEFGRLQRISSYALPKDIISKSDEELRALPAHLLDLEPYRLSPGGKGQAKEEDGSQRRDGPFHSHRKDSPQRGTKRSRVCPTSMTS